jgi:hypothetical protein
MTVAASGDRSSTAGNGVTTVFTADFRANSSAEVGVVTINTTTKVVTPKVLNTDYTLELDADTGQPTVTFLAAPASGNNVLIYPANAVKQEVSPTPGGPLFGSTIEEALDKIAAQLQALEDKIGQCVRVPQADTAIAALSAADGRFNKFLTFNSTGVPALRDLSEVGL